MNTRTFAKTAIQNAMAEALLQAGKTVAFAKQTHIEIHRRRGHLTSIESAQYKNRDQKYATVVFDELVKFRKEPE
jgi:hypothetical protein